MIDRSKLKPIIEIKNEEVKQLASEAENFLLSHHWCNTIVSGYLSWAIAGVIGVFLFDIIASKPEVDETLWVVTGDLPPAYLVTDDADSWQAALDSYVYEMRRWVTAVQKGDSLDELIPVNAAPTAEHADMLESRLKFIEDNMINVSDNSLESDS